MRNWLLEKAVMPLGDRIFGHNMMSRLRFLQDAQWWSRERIETERTLLLQRVVRVAWEEVPFYRDLFQQNGVSPHDIHTIADLHKLPVVNKELLRQAYPGRVCRDTGHRTYETVTSGSTGANFQVRQDNETAGWYRASFMLALNWAGWRIGEPHVQTGMTPARNLERRLKDALLGCHYFVAYDLSDAHLSRCLELMKAEGIDHLWGYPGSLFYLAKFASKSGLGRQLKSIVTWGDQLFPHYRQQIESVFKVKVHDTYGCAEGFQIAAQCDHFDHYHVHSLDVVVEYLDDTGRPVPEGKPGKIVITRLHPGPMPFIRYQNGDVGISSKSIQCPCSRGFELMQSVLGRTADVITTPTGNRLIVHFFTGILEHFRELETFQVVQKRPDSLVVRVVPAAGYVAGTAEKIRSALREKGADLSIEIEEVPAIPLTPGGKRRFVIRECALPTNAQA